MKDFEKEILSKIDTGEKLSELELMKLCYICYIWEEEYRELRYGKEIKTIVKLDNRYFSIIWVRSVIGDSHNEYENQPVEVRKHTYEKTINVTEWIPIK